MKDYTSRLVCALVVSASFAGCSGGEKKESQPVAQATAVSASPAVVNPAPAAQVQPGQMQQTAKLIQENLAAIRKIANSQRAVEGDFKKLFQDMADGQAAHRAALDRDFLAKDPEGAALLKSEKELRAAVEALTLKVREKGVTPQQRAEIVAQIKEKQKELSQLGANRSKIMAKFSQQPEFRELQKANAQRSSALNDKMVSLVGGFSEEGKKLVAEREQLMASLPKRPAPPEKK